MPDGLRVLLMQKVQLHIFNTSSATMTLKDLVGFYTSLELRISDLVGEDLIDRSIIARACGRWVCIGIHGAEKSHYVGSLL